MLLPGNYRSGTRTTPVTTPLDDPWNYWIYQIGGNAWFSTVETVTDAQFSIRATASRVTDQQKMYGSYRFNYSESDFKINGDSSILSIKRSMSGYLLYVHSISDHFSAGGSIRAWQSTFSNYSFGFSVKFSGTLFSFPESEISASFFTPVSMGS